MGFDARRDLQLLNLSAASYNTALVLMTQLGWRLWRHVGEDEFPAYHRAWWFGWGGLQPVLWPGVVIHAAGSMAQLRDRPAPARTLSWAVLGLQAATAASTALWWGRQQARLGTIRLPDGELDLRYRRVVGTHWIRVGLVGATAVAQAALTRKILAAQAPAAR